MVGIQTLPPSLRLPMKMKTQIDALSMLPPLTGIGRYFHKNLAKVDLVITVSHLIEKNKKNIIYLDYLEDKELAIVYKSASLFVYPSFDEGFGLPVIEAMACVICSNTSALPEIAQDKDIQQQMRNKGLLQAQKFSWEKSASQHHEAFMEIVHK